MARSGGKVYLHVDVSDAKQKIDALRAVHTENEMKALLRRAFTRTGRHVRTILKEDIPRHYNVKPAWVLSHVGNPKTSLGGGIGVSCTIPINGARGTIGGRFSASGGARGWRAVGRRYKINARILKGQASTLPGKMHHQGGNPPFRNLGSKLGKAAFTRVGKERFPIVPVVGLGVPQMPLNRSKDDVQEDIKDMLMKRLEAEHKYIISKCR